jgi:hypothetical protein
MNYNLESHVTERDTRINESVATTTKILPAIFLASSIITIGTKLLRSSSQGFLLLAYEGGFTC